MPLDLRSLTPLLQVFDMPASLAFYRDSLGFAVVGDVPPDDRADWVMLSHGGIEIMLNTRYEADDRPAEPHPASMMVHEDTSLYFGCPDIDAAYAWLRERGLEPELPKIAPYGMRQMYLIDPDGYVLCFTWPAQ